MSSPRRLPWSLGTSDMHSEWFEIRDTAGSIVCTVRREDANLTLLAPDLLAMVERLSRRLGVADVDRLDAEELIARSCDGERIPSPASPTE